MPTDLILAPKFCRSCGNALAAGDRFCSHCGVCLPQTVPAATPAASPNASTAPTTQASIDLSPTVQTILQNRWIVIALLAATGPLGLPALWFSPRFRPWSKIAISVTYFLLTIVFPLAVTWYWLDYSLQPLVEAFQVPSP